ncbi:UNVERIFIED_CONTAM: hypothetical protein HDU68_009771 [Siphonaria sp. JEL0065]|nr:hypothetical protein HDU68_009771 [Siphonaria sp. JEL0065]
MNWTGGNGQRGFGKSTLSLLQTSTKTATKTVNQKRSEFKKEKLKKLQKTSLFSRLKNLEKNERNRSKSLDVSQLVISPDLKWNSRVGSNRAIPRSKSRGTVAKLQVNDSDSDDGEEEGEEEEVPLIRKSRLLANALPQQLRQPSTLQPELATDSIAQKKKAQSPPIASLSIVSSPSIASVQANAKIVKPLASSTLSPVLSSKPSAKRIHRDLSPVLSAKSRQQPHSFSMKRVKSVQVEKDWMAMLWPQDVEPILRDDENKIKKLKRAERVGLAARVDRVEDVERVGKPRRARLVGNLNSDERNAVLEVKKEKGFEVKNERVKHSDSEASLFDVSSNSYSLGELESRIKHVEERMNVLERRFY